MPAAVKRSAQLLRFVHRARADQHRPALAAQRDHLCDHGVELGVLGRKDAVGPVLADRTGRLVGTRTTQIL